jgi:hypothetical protein
MKRTKITLKRHKEIAKKLEEIRKFSSDLWIEVGEATGTSAIACKQARKFYYATNELRNVMDNLCEQLGTPDSWAVYFSAHKSISRDF